MSTRERYGNAVYTAALEVASSGVGEFFAHFTTGDVVRWAGVSAPTARKYILELIKSGHVRAVPAARGVFVMTHLKEGGL